MVNTKNSSEHSKRPFGHRIEQDAKSLLGSHSIVGTVISFPEITAAVFTFISLLPRYLTTLYNLL
jgi:hypothetical protein